MAKIKKIKIVKILLKQKWLLILPSSVKE